MAEANVISVFVGIESPNEASLRETKKFQNVRAGGHDAREGAPNPGRRHGGLVRDDSRLRQRRRDHLRRPAGIHPGGADRLLAMIGMLHALPKTPLYDRLGRRGPARPGGRVGVRHQRHPAQAGPRGPARRLRPGAERPLRARSLFRAARRAVHRRAARGGAGAGPVLGGATPGDA